MIFLLKRILCASIYKHKIAVHTEAIFRLQKPDRSEAKFTFFPAFVFTMHNS